MPKLTRLQRAIALRDAIHPSVMRDGQLAMGGFRLLTSSTMTFAAQSGALEVFYGQKVMNLRWNDDGNCKMAAFAPGDWDARLLAELSSVKFQPIPGLGSQFSIREMRIC